MNTELTVAAGALEAHERAEGDGGPRRVLGRAVEADLLDQAQGEGRHEP